MDGETPTEPQAKWGTVHKEEVCPYFPKCFHLIFLSSARQLCEEDIAGDKA
jgi:hypothetical protein